MTDDDAEGSGQGGSHGEDEELTVRRWQRELDEMTPEERERVIASFRGSVDKMKSTLASNAAVKVNMKSMLAQQRRLAQTMSESLAQTLRSSTLPFANLSTQKLLAGVDFSGFENLRTQISTWILEQSGMVEAMKGLGEALLRWFPANLHGLPEGSLGQVSDIVRDDGIALYGAPRQEIVIELIAAPDRESRRNILGSRAVEISVDCRALLETCSSEWSRSITPFALEALDSFDAGHTASAQALAASIVDTLLRALYRDRRTQYTPSKAGARNPRTAEALDSLPFREYLAVSPIWQAHQQFWVEKGDTIPETFNRNASAHAVSAEQYTLVNAVQSLLYSSTLLWYIDQEMRRVEAAGTDPAITADSG